MYLNIVWDIITQWCIEIIHQHQKLRIDHYEPNVIKRPEETEAQKATRRDRGTKSDEGTRHRSIEGTNRFYIESVDNNFHGNDMYKMRYSFTSTNFCIREIVMLLF